MNKNASSYVKLYDAEVIPLLLRRPPATSSSAYSSSGALWCGTNVLQPASVRRQESEFIQRTSRLLFHWSPRNLIVKNRDSSSASSPEQHERGVHKANNGQAETNPELVVPEVETEKLGLFARFKKMYKEYWYVLLPVHCVTSACWLGGFYYVSIR